MNFNLTNIPKVISQNIYLVCLRDFSTSSYLLKPSKHNKNKQKPCNEEIIWKYICSSL